MKKLVFLAAAVLMAAPLSAQKYGATPEDSIECIKNLSIYQEFYKQKAYVDAYPAWKEVLQYCPNTSKNTYIRGNVILKQMIAKTSDAEAKKQYIDELMQLWDLRMQYYGEPSYCKGQKASDMRTYMPDAVAEARALFLEAMKDEKEVRNYAIPFLYLRTVIDAYKASQAEKDEIIEAYEQGSALLDIFQAAKPDDEKIEEAMVGLDALLEPYATCVELVPLYEKKFDDNKDNADFLKKATGMLDKRGCTDAEIFFKMTEALHAIAPTPQSAYLMAKMCYAKKDYQTAINYIQGQEESLEKDNEKVNAYLLLADSYQNTNQYANGRAACLKAIEINPESGRAYLVLGNIYAAGAKACGADAQVSQRAAYWVAVDTYIKAKQVDPSIAETADKLISTYKAYFPSGDDLFTFGYKEGESYTIDCCFRSTTTIRER